MSIFKFIFQRAMAAKALSFPCDGIFNLCNTFGFIN